MDNNTIISVISNVQFFFDPQKEVEKNMAHMVKKIADPCCSL